MIIVSVMCDHNYMTSEFVRELQVLLYINNLYSYNSSSVFYLNITTNN